MFEDRVMQYAIVGTLWGFLCGVGPLIYGVKHKKELLGVIGMFSCAASGAFLGVFLAVPVALIFFAVIVVVDSEKKQ